MDDDGEVCDIEKPIGVVESKAREQVARGIVSECCIPHAPTEHIEDGGDDDAQLGGFSHRLVLRWRRLDRILHVEKRNMGVSTNRSPLTTCTDQIVREKKPGSRSG